MSSLLPDGQPKILVNVGISVLSAVLTVLLVIPGNQGESVISTAIEVLKGLVM